MKKITILQIGLVLLLFFLASIDLNAQLKVGMNPKTLSSNIYFEVESIQGSKFIVTKDSAKVGIGTSNPSAKLEINNGTIPGAIKIIDGTEGIGKVLTSNATGLGVWAVPTVNSTNVTNSKSLTNSNGIIVVGGTGATLQNTTLRLDSAAIAKMINQSPIKDSLLNVVNANTSVATTFNITTRVLTTTVNGVTSSVTIPNVNDSTTASNGLTLTGKDVRLGGTLTSATTITTSNTNTLALSGLQNGTSGDSLVSLGAGGVLRKVAVSAVVTGDNWGSQTVAVSVPLTGNGTSGSPLNITRANTTAANNLVTVTNGTNATFTAMTVGVDTTNLKSYLNNKITVSSSAPLSGNGTSGSPLSLTSNNTTAGQLVTVTNGTGASLTNMQVGVDTTALKTFVNGRTTVSNAFNTSTRALTTTVNGITSNAVTIPTTNDSTTASNGLTLTGKDVRLGGTLNTATIINQGTNLMTFTGTPSSANSSVLTLSNTATGANGTVLLDMLTPSSDVSYYRIGKSNTTGNSSEITYRNVGNNSDSNSLSFGFFGNQYLVNLTKNGNLGIGSNLFVPTQKLDVDGGARIRSLASGSTTDSIVTVDATGVLRRRSLSAVVSGDNWGSQTVAVSTPLTGNGTSGSPLSVTRANTTATNNLVTITNGTNATFTAMSVGVDTTNLKSFLNNKITVSSSAPLSGNGTSGSPLSLTSNNTTAGQLVTVTNGTGASLTNMQVGVDTTALKTFVNGRTTVSNAFNTSTRALTTTVNGITSNAVTIPTTNDSTTASNGLTLTGKDIRLGGTLTSATTITTSNTNTLALSGLQNGTSGDSLVSLGAGGVLRKVAVSAVVTGDNWGSQVAQVSAPLSGNGTSGSPLSVTRANTTATNNLVTITNGTNATFTAMSVGVDTTNLKSFLNNKITVSSSAPLSGNGTSGSPLSLTSNNTTAGQLVTVTNGTGASLTNMQVGVDTTALKSFVNGRTTVSNAFNTSTRALTTTVNGITSNAVTIPTTNDSTTASNGLNINGKDVRLGGTLTSATTINQGTNLMTFTGTPSSANSSVVTLSNTATGSNGTVLLDMLTPNSDVSYYRLGKSTSFGNSAEITYRYTRDNSDSNSLSLGFYNSQYLVNLTKNGNLGIGSNLFVPTQKLDVDGGARIRSLASGATTDSIVTVDGTGVLRRRSLSAVVSGDNWGSQTVAVSAPLTGNGTSGSPLNITRANTTAANNLVTVANGTNATFTAMTVGVDTTNLKSFINARTTNTLTASSNAITNTTNGIAATLTPSAGTLTTKFLGFDASGNLVTDTALTSANNIYNIDGTLTGNRTVTQGTNTITFTGSAVNSFSVDGSTFSVDGANNRIGVGTSTPTETLDVRGNAQIGNSDTSNFIAFRGLTTDGAGGYGFTYIGNRLYGGADKSELVLYQGNDADASSGPDRIRLMSGELKFQTNSTFTSATTFPTVANDPLFVDRMIIKNDGKVGIGVSTPTDLLDVNGTARIRTLSSGSTSDSIVTADANGVLRRRNAATILSGATTNTLTSATNTMTNTTNGVAASASIINTNALSVSGNSLTSTINGVASNAATVPNIYTADGTLTGNRTVTQGANTLTFNTTPTADYTAGVNIYNNAFGNPGVTILNMVSPNSDTSFYRLGKILSGGNVAEISYTHRGNNNDSNRLSFGFHSSRYLLNLMKNGNLSIGNIIATEKLDVDGTARIRTLNAGASSDSIVTADANGVLRRRNATAILSGATTNTLSSATNTMTNTTNGVAGSAPIINSNALSISGNTLTSTINGVVSNNATISNIYTADGTLTGERTVTNNGNVLNFQGTGGSGFPLRLRSGTTTSSEVTLGIYDRSSSDSKGWMIGSNTYNGVANANGNLSRELHFATLGFVNSGVKMKIDSAGNVGIGRNTDAAVRLAVQGGIAVGNGNFAIDSTYVQDNNFVTFRHNGTSEDFIGYRNNTFYFADCPGGSDVTNPNVMVLGNLGVGNTTPAAKLHVTGNARITSMSLGSATDSIVVVDANGELKKRASSSVATSNQLSASLSATVPALSIGDVGSVTVTIAGAAVGDAVIVNPTSDLPAGVVIAYSRVSAANTIKIGFSGTGSSSAYSQTFDIKVIK